MTRQRTRRLIQHALAEMTRRIETALLKFGYHSFDALLLRVDPR